MLTHQPSVSLIERQSTADTWHPVSGPDGRLQDLRALGWLLVIRCSRLKPDMIAGERHSTHHKNQTPLSRAIAKGWAR